VTQGDPRWFEDFFGLEWLDLIALARTVDTAAEVDFIVHATSPPPGASVLDVGCGHGRHSLELARRGFRVTGVDLSEPSLEVARRAASDEGLEVAFVRADMRDIAFEGHFEVAINMFTAFGYFEDDADHARTLSGIARALRVGGSLLIDTVNPLWLFRHFDPTTVSRLDDGTLFLEERGYDALLGRSHATWTFIRPDGSRHEQWHTMRLYTLAELAALLRRAGLDIVETWGDLAGAEYGMDTNRMVVLSRKSA